MIGLDVDTGKLGIAAALIILPFLLSSSIESLFRYPSYPSFLSRYSHLPYLLLLESASTGPTPLILKAHSNLKSSALITGPKRLHLSNPSKRLIKHIARLPKAQSYSAFDILGCSTVFSERDNFRHAQKVNCVKSLFSKSELSRRFEGVERCVDEMIEYLNDRFHAKESGKDEHGRPIRVKVNLLDLFRSFSIDAISTYALDRSYSSISELKGGLKLLETIKDSTERSSIGLVNDHFNSGVPLALYNPRLSAWFTGFKALGLKFRLIKEDQEEVEALNRFYAFVNKVTEDAREETMSVENDSGLNYASRLANVCGNSESLSADVSDMLFAGVESLSSTLSLTLLHLFKSHQEAPSSSTSFLTLLQQELDSLDTAFEAAPSLSKLETLPRLQALIKEGLRVTSPVPRSLDREVTEEGLVLDDGTRIKKGWVVGISAADLNSDPEVYHDPQVFKPERWLDVESRKESTLTFGLVGSPSRACLGQTLAMAEMTLVLARFIQNFDIGNEVEIPEGRDWWNKGFENGVVGEVGRRPRSL